MSLCFMVVDPPLWVYLESRQKQYIESWRLGISRALTGFEQKADVATKSQGSCLQSAMLDA